MQITSFFSPISQWLLKWFFRRLCQLKNHFKLRATDLRLEIVEWDVSITGFVIEEIDSVQFYHDIISCLESDSIVVNLTFHQVQYPFPPLKNSISIVVYNDFDG